MKDKCAVAFLRISQLMMGIIEATETRDKERLIMLSRNLDEDSKLFIGECLILAGVTDEELDQLTPSEDNDEELLKDAASASTLRYASVKS